MSSYMHTYSGVAMVTLTPLPFESEEVSFPLQSLRGDQSLDLGGLVPLGLPLLQGEGPSDHVLPHIILLAQVVHLTDPAHTLRAKSAWNGSVSETWG